MKSAIATIDLDVDPRRNYSLPGSGSPSLMFVFGSGPKLGARAISASGTNFEPGTHQEEVRLDFFWPDDDSLFEVVEPGASFTIWYSGGVGHGKIDRLV